MGEITSLPSLVRKLRYGHRQSVASSELDWDVAQGSILAVIVDQDVTINAPTNLVVGQTYFLELHIESYDTPQITFDPIFGISSDALNLQGGQVNVLLFVFNGSKLLMLSSAAYEFTAAWNATLAPTPNIATSYDDWRWWQHQRIGQFAQHCPIERSTTYYVSNDGDNGNDGLSPATPFETIAKAQTVIAPDVRVRFKRGDIWEESTGLTITDDNVTIDDYGDGDLPFFNRFVKDYSDATWTNAAGDRWTTSETATIRWVREKLDRLGETRGTHLIRVASSAAVESTPNSWFWGSNVLHVNLDGDDPNAVDLEGVEQNSESGIKLSFVDGCRIRNIRADGWGAIGANLGYPFMSQVSGDDANMFECLEGYVSGTHIMGHLASGTSGGKLLMVNCKAGYEIDPTGDGHFIAFSQSGQHEAWCINCEAVYGAMKTSTWNPSAVPANLGTAFAAHTTTGEPSMIVSYGLRIRQGITGCIKGTGIDQNDTSSITSPSDFTNCRSFEVNTRLDMPPQARVFDPGDGRIKYGCRYFLRPAVAAATFVGLHPAVPENKRLYFVNCYLQLDFQNVPTNSRLLLFNRTSSSVNAVEFIHSFVDYINTGFRSDFTTGFDYAVYSSASLAVGTGSSKTSRMLNSIFSADSATPVNVVALSNTSTSLLNNAYRNIDQSADVERGFNNDAGGVVMSSQPVFGVSNAQLLLAGSTGILLSHDINGKRRTVSVPDIGPVDFSS